MEYYELRAMNTDVLLAANGASAALGSAFAAAHDFIRRAEQRLTRFTETSELSQLNRSAGLPFAASPELYDVVAQAVSFADQTGGLFDPTVLDALEAAGYDRSMDDIRVSGAGPSRRPVHRFGAWQSIVLDPAAQTITLPPGVRLDLGGIAKGWIAEKAAAVLAQWAPACAVNAGGDMFAIGAPDGAAGWQVALEDPRDPLRVLAVLEVEPGAIVTSSTMRRRWLQGDREQHHLIDPRRAAPAQSDLLSVTAIASSAVEAEVFAKAILIAGSRQAPALAAIRPSLAFIAVDHDGRLWGSPTAQRYLQGVETHV